MLGLDQSGTHRACAPRKGRGRGAKWFFNGSLLPFDAVAAGPRMVLS